MKPARKGKTVVEFLPDADQMERTPLPAWARTTVYVLAAALVSFVLWASFSKIDTVVVASGRLVNPMPNLVVQPLEAAVISTIDARVGQVVRKGEVLATLDPTFSRADEAALETRLKSLENQIEGYQRELDGAGPAPAGTGADSRLQQELARQRQGAFEAQRTKMNENLGRMKAALDTNLRDQHSLSMRARSLREIEQMQEKLVAQQYGARLHLLEAREKRQEVERELLLTKSREYELRREQAAFVAETSAFEKGSRQKTMEELLAASRERDAVREELAKAGKRHQLVTLVAPADGVVLEMAKLSQGSVIKAAETMFTLVPLNAALEAEVQIDAADVGYVRSGDAAHVKLDAFPFQRHGALAASVRTISEDAFRREGGADKPYFMGRIAFGNARLRNMGKQARMLPGMTVTAEIVVGKRTVMSYLVWPLTKALDESIREP